jgi:hypothetical protein
VKIDEETRIFMLKHSIAESDVFDAGQMPRRRWQSEMKKAGKRFVFGSPCQRGGHRLRNRHGACLVCNPHSIGFERHYRSPGTVYVAASSATGFVKIGGEGSMATDVRARTLNSQSYGGANDWRIVHREEVQEVGKIEALAQATLKRFQVLGQTYRGDQREAWEMFRCSTADAIEAVKRAAAAHTMSPRPKSN